MASDDLSRRNFLLGRLRGDSRAQAEAAWKGNAKRPSGDAPLPRVISWLEDSLEGSSPRQRGADREAAFPVLRPPGALAEHEFLEACTRCGDCIEACEPGAIRIAPERMRAAAGTPMIDASESPCMLCEDLPCITACEPGALRIEAPAALGTARVQALDCLNRLGSTCSVCVERCPIPSALSWVDGVPAVDATLCTGCGQCHHACPAPINAIAILPNAERPTREKLEARIERASAPAATAESPIPLPELHDEVIDDELLARLFSDLAALAQVIEIQLKGAARAHAEPIGLDLGKAQDRLLSGEVRALQIVYRYDDETWCDTLMRLPKGTRVLRMRAPARAAL